MGFRYFEDEVEMGMTTSGKTIAMERVTTHDCEMLDLLGFDMPVVVKNHTVNAEGVCFDTTWSRLCLDYYFVRDHGSEGMPN